MLAFCEAMRRPSITHLDPSLLNMLLRSKDGGQSWDGPQVIAGYDFAGMDDPGMVQLSSGVLLVNTARNSFVSLDRADGDAAYTGYNRREGFAWASSYPIAEGTYVHRSEDGGRTWSGSARRRYLPFCLRLHAAPDHRAGGWEPAAALLRREPGPVPVLRRALL